MSLSAPLFGARPCPRLSELPPPPAGKTGWPWTEEAPPCPEVLPDGKPWPRISIVTPSFNQGQFIEETIRSVLLQGYPDLDYIIIDGGSTDQSVEVIRRYAPWLAYWVSEKDRGQSHAINKGFARISGEILGWLNSDDLLVFGALRNAACSVMGHFDEPCLILGKRLYVDGNSIVTRSQALAPLQPNLSLITWGISPGLYQESTLWTRPVWQLAGPLTENLFIAFDLEFFCKALAAGARSVTCPGHVGVWRQWGGTKCETRRKQMGAECRAVCKIYRTNLSLLRFALVRTLVRAGIGFWASVSTAAGRTHIIGKPLSIKRSVE